LFYFLFSFGRTKKANNATRIAATQKVSIPTKPAIEAKKIKRSKAEITMLKILRVF